MLAFMRIHAMLRDLGSDQRGNVAISFAIATIPIIGFAGSAIDYSRANSAKASMQAALDAAALTLSKEAQGLSAAALNSKADAYFKANFNRPEAKNIIVTPAFTDLGNGNFKIPVAGTATIDTTITGMWQNNIAIGANSQVLWGYKKLELALALDNTGSMASSNKMAHLKTAAKSLIDTLKKAAKAPGDIKVAIIPFDTTVKIGTGYKDQLWFDVSCSALGNPSGCNSGNWKNYWEGCVRDRTQPYDAQDNPPNTGTPASLYPIYDCGSLVNIMPLTYDWTALNARIDAMQPNGNTNVTIGLAWAWHAVTAAAPLSEASAPKPDLDKVIILLTDGENTQAWNNSNNTNITNVTTINARTTAACNNVKAAGIKLYTVRVIDGNANLLSQCATNPTMFYDVQDAASSIRFSRPSHRSLASLRLSQ